VPAIAVDGLRKSYGNREVLQGIDLTVDAGECLALLGPNGAGKTTLVEILEGHRRRTSGRVEVLGTDPEKGSAGFRDRIGIVLQEAGIEGDLRAGEALRVFGRYYRRPRPAAELLELVGLDEAASAPIKTLSGGQRRRLDLALGLVGRPDLVFLDEPTTGFDPAARRTAWSLISGIKAAGTTVLLTTHYLDEAQSLADRVAVLVEGRIRAEGAPDELAGNGNTLVAFRLPAELHLADLPPSVAPATLDSDGLTVLVETSTATTVVGELTQWALGRGAELEGLVVRRPTLEDTYHRLAGDAGGADAR
jgi:ABC-2 type transport system ATP-binding protein